MTTVVDITTGRDPSGSGGCRACATAGAVCSYHRGVADGVLALAEQIRGRVLVDEDLVNALATGYRPGQAAEGAGPWARI